MSVEQLKLDTGLTILRTNMSGSLFVLTVDCEDRFNNKVYSMCAVLDRNQAHLLKLWLEEHLK